MFGEGVQVILFSSEKKVATFLAHLGHHIYAHKSFKLQNVSVAHSTKHLYGVLLGILGAINQSPPGKPANCSFQIDVLKGVNLGLLQLKVLTHNHCGLSENVELFCTYGVYDLSLKADAAPSAKRNTSLLSLRVSPKKEKEDSDSGPSLVVIASAVAAGTAGSDAQTHEKHVVADEGVGNAGFGYGFRILSTQGCHSLRVSLDGQSVAFSLSSDAAPQAKLHRLSVLHLWKAGAIRAQDVAVGQWGQEAMDTKSLQLKFTASTHVVYLGQVQSLESVWKAALSQDKDSPATLYGQLTTNVIDPSAVDGKATFTQKGSLRLLLQSSSGLANLIELMGLQNTQSSSNTKLVTSWHIGTAGSGKQFQTDGVALVSTKSLQVGKGPQTIFEKK